MLQKNSRMIPIAGAAMALCLGTSLAHAQSSVTISGIADAAARYVSNEGRGSVKSLVSGSNSTSRLIVRGTEDLGGGLSAGFHLEHGIAFDTGSPTTANQFWDRRSTVSVASTRFGEIRAGRDFVPSYVNWSRYDPFAHVGVAGSNNMSSATPVGPIRSAFGTNPNTTVRSSNSVQYFLPSGIGGIEGGLMVAAGEGGTAANGLDKVTAVRLGYAAGAFGVSAAHTRTENDLTTVGAFTDSVIGVNVDVWNAKLTAAHRQYKYNQAKQTNTMVAVIVPVGAVGEVKASALRANLSGNVGAVNINDNDTTQLGLGYVHFLSKRSALYTTFSRINNKGAATFVVPGGPAGIAGGQHSTGYEAGMRHSF